MRGVRLAATAAPVVVAMGVSLPGATGCTALFGFDRPVPASACATNADCAPDQTCACGRCLTGDPQAMACSLDGAAATAGAQDATTEPSSPTTDAQVVATPMTPSDGDNADTLCPSGFAPACPGSDSSVCTDVTSDPANCGACGRACKSTLFCERAECRDEVTLGSSGPACSNFASLTPDVLWAFHLQAPSDVWLESVGIETTPPGGIELTLGVYADDGGGMPGALLTQGVLKTGIGADPTATPTGTTGRGPALTNRVVIPSPRPMLHAGSWYFVAVLVRSQDGGNLGPVVCADVTSLTTWYRVDPFPYGSGALPDPNLAFQSSPGPRPHIFIETAQISSIDP